MNQALDQDFQLGVTVDVKVWVDRDRSKLLSLGIVTDGRLTESWDGDTPFVSGARRKAMEFTVVLLKASKAILLSSQRKRAS